jgi:nicotinamide-nucleotide amidase
MPTIATHNNQPDTNSKLEKLVRLLVEQKQTIAFAESMSAGFLAYRFSTVEGSGEVFLGSLVCYQPALKTSLLKVPQALIQEYSAESMAVTVSMAEGLMNLVAPSIGVAITGLCSPGGSECEEKPVGTVFVVFSQQRQQETISWSRRYLFKGSAERIVEQTVEHITDELMRHLLRHNSVREES